MIWFVAWFKYWIGRQKLIMWSIMGNFLRHNSRLGYVPQQTKSSYLVGWMSSFDISVGRCHMQYRYYHAPAPTVSIYASYAVNKGCTKTCCYEIPDKTWCSVNLYGKYGILTPVLQNRSKLIFFIWSSKVLLMTADQDDVIKENVFRITGPFVRGIHWPPVNSPHNG